MASRATLLCLTLVSVIVHSVSAWSQGRATWYDDAPWMTVDYGSCGYGYIDNERFPGYAVAAISDSSGGSGSCGTCYEVRCGAFGFSDGYGEFIDRSSVCYDTSASVVVKITDSCPCYKENNYHSNQRWCCGDMFHMDIAIWAFEKLADTKWGVIGIEYQQVGCGTVPSKQASNPNGSQTGRRDVYASLADVGGPEVLNTLDNAYTKFDETTPASQGR